MSPRRSTTGRLRICNEDERSYEKNSGTKREQQPDGPGVATTPFPRTTDNHQNGEQQAMVATSAGSSPACVGSVQRTRIPSSVSSPANSTPHQAVSSPSTASMHRRATADRAGLAPKRARGSLRRRVSVYPCALPTN